MKHSTFEKSDPTYNILKEDYFMVVDITENKYLIGEINFDEPINEYSIESGENLPSIKKVGQCKVEVYDDEGAIPHFHVIGGGKNFCICIHTNKYFSHKRGKYSQFSNTTQKEQLNNWLKEKNVKFAKGVGKSLTNYQAIVELWDQLNGNPYGFDFSIQPEYDKMWEEIKES